MDESVRVVVDTAPVRVVVTGSQGPSGGVGGIINHLSFDTTPSTVPTTEGVVSWNAEDHTLDIQTEVANTRIQAGQENVIRVRNTTGSLLADGTAVYITGASGQRATVGKALASDASHVRATIGLVTSDIADNNNGYVTTQGLVRGVNTSAFAEGAVLYLSDATAGSITDTAPTANDVVRIGWCVVSGSNGTILVSVRRMSVSSSDVIDATSDAWPASNRVLKANAGSLRLSELICNGPIRSSQVLIQSFDNDTGEADGFYATITLPSGMTQNSGLIAPKASGSLAVTSRTDGIPDKLNTGATTYALLGSASSVGAGYRAFITDCATATFLATASGGGVNKVPVVSDGTNWLVG